MTNGQKVSVSLLITILLFAAFAFASFAGLFELLELRFYQPAVEKNAAMNLEQIAKSFDEYVNSYRTRFQSFVSASSLQKTVLSTQDKEDIVEREDLIGRLLSETNGFLGLRVIDSNGRRIHYSSFKTDVMRTTKTSISYENYDDINELQYEQVNCLEEEKFKLIFDEKLNRILYSFPFIDMYSAYRGTCVFYVAVKDFERFLVNKNIISYAESLGILISETGEKAFVLDLPVTGSDLIKDEILVKWNDENHKVVPLLLGEIDSWVMVKDNTSSYAKIIRVYNENVFTFSNSIKILFLVCFCMTLFLVIFILFNLKHDEMVEIRDKIKKYQFGIISEYLEKKEEYNWEQISNEITLRKTNASNELKKILGRSGKKHGAEVEQLLEKSWEEIFAAIGKKDSSKNQLGNVEEIKLLLEQLIQDKAYAIPVTQVTSVTEKTPVKNLEPVEELEEVEEVEDLEPIEELEEVEGVEDLEPVEELEEVEEVEDLEPIEELEEVEEVEDLEPIEELEEVEEVEDLEPVEELKKVEDLTSADENDDEYYELPPEEMKFGDVPRSAEEEVPDFEFHIVPPMFTVLDTFGLDHIDLDENDILLDETVADIDKSDKDVVDLPEAESVEELDVVDLPEAESVEGLDVVDLPEAESVEELDVVDLPEAESVEELDGVFTNSFSFSNPFEDHSITDVIIEDIESIDDNEHQPIVEEDGLFSIGNVISMSDNLIDHDFQKLVDSVL